MRSVLALIIVSIVSVGCAAESGEIDPENYGEVALANEGVSSCAANGTVCWMWSGMNTVTGACVGGSCCTGCVNSRGQCVGGATEPACGSHGGKCKDCNDGNACTADSCVSGTCQSTTLDDGSQCSLFPLMTCADGNCH